MRRPYAPVAAAVAGLLAASLPATAVSAGHDPRILHDAPAVAPASDGSGNFRIQCGVSHHVADDPIVRPGVPSGSHLHAFAGNTAVDAYSTAESLRATGEGSCHGGTLNRSGYWIPSLHDADGQLLRLDPWHVYYKNGALDPATVRPMPQGLRMVAGNARATAAQPLEVVRLSCGSTPIRRVEDFSSTMPACAQGDFVAISVIFPQCWNGRDLDSADHVSHMAYAVAGGQPWHVCPTSHPVPLPQITVNLHQVVRDQRGSAGWRLSSDAAGAPGGRTMHADWFDGWDRGVVQTFVSSCIHRRLDCSGGNLGDGTRLSWFTEPVAEVRTTAPRATAPRSRCAATRFPILRGVAASRQRARHCAAAEGAAAHSH